MLKKNEIIALLTLVCCAFGVAAQDYRLTLNIVLDTDPAVQSEAPLSVKKPSDPVRIDWIEMQGVGLQIPKATPHDAHIYYSRTPNGGDTSKYTRINIMDTGTASMTPNVNKKYIRFVPEANNIGAGAYYCIIAYVADSVTFYSNYFELKVASPNAPILKDPKGLMGSIKEINELTPVFSWDPVEGVPYYHVVLSDEQLPFDSIITGGEIKLDLSIVWQAITPNTRITYGAPDPSNTITASPPPLSPGKEYSWLVFNNYGNHTAFSDGNAFDVPGAFRIRGDTLKTPRVVSPINNTEESGDKITFSWTDLDDRANSYLVNLFFNTTPQDLGVGELNQLDANASASMLVWETTVSRGAGNILSVDLLNAKGTLTGGNYVWRVYALDSRGAATTGDISKGAFKYAGVSSGKVAIKTFELVAGEESGIGYVELKSEVISGPMQAPLAFYTLADGYLERDFPEGTYRITAVKDGYNAQTVTFSVTGGSTTPVRIYMRRPDAVIYGRVAGPDNAAVNLAKVTAVSEWGDTVAAMTNGSGNFTLNCRAADWTVTIEKAGYRVPRSKDTTLRQGDNVNIGTIYLERNPNTLSGVVRNSTGVPVIGAKVRVLREGVLVEELASTPQNGAYSFALMSGTYTLTAEKPGFAMYSRTVNLTGSRNQDITIADSAALINGVVIGERWKSQRFGGGDDYDYAPIPNAKVTFISVVSSSSERPDTFTVTSDATFGKFSLSVSGGKTFKVMAEASGFVDISGSTAPTITTKADSTITFNDTLRALAMIKGNVTGDAVADVDIIVYDTSKNMVAASTKSSNDGSFEIRNIPDGNYIINAGKSEYYLSKDGFNDGLNVDNGRPEPSFYTLTMLSGNKTITWNVTGYNGRGSIKVTSPLNKTIPFSRETVAVLESVGPGDYIIEAVAEADTTLLQLSYNKFRVESEDSFTSEVRFPLSHRSADSLARGGGGGVTVKIAWVGSWSSDVKKSELFYRSEGSAQYSVQPSQSDDKFSFAVTPDRDGCDLQYYFRVYLENGDIYGSAKQIFTSYVKPSANIISRIDVEPGSSGDTLYMPSSYAAPFAFKAFYSDQFIPFGESVNFGSVAWSVVGSGASVSGSGRNATLTTGAQKSDFVLRAVLTPSSGYTLKNGKARDTVAIPVNVTGSRLKGVAVIRNGGSGPVSNTEKTSFRVEASDTTGKSVTVSPLWSITPETAGKVGVDGLFQPKPDFFGVVRVYAEVGGKRAEYAEAGAGLPGLSVNYPLRNKTVEDTASTHRGLRLAFPVNSIPSGESVELHAVIHSTSGDLKNSVHRGSGGFRMADSLSYDVEFSRVNVVDSVVSIIIDVPAHLRQDAAKAPDNFKVARWYPDSLKWITLPSSEVISGGAAVAAKLSRDAKDSHINANRNNGKLGKKAKMLMKSAAGKAKSDVGAASESQLYASARYAVVIQSSKLSVDLAVSPNPFSPYIRPFREYGRYYASRSVVPPGTCIRVSIEAPESSVRSLKVHVYNATGKRVWAVDKFNAEVGENRIWWDGRTTSREEMWDDESFLEKNRDKGRMCRNGRYFVTVIVTDIEGRQQRAMKPLVLMK